MSQNETLKIQFRNVSFFQKCIFVAIKFFNSRRSSLFYSANKNTYTGKKWNKMIRFLEISQNEAKKIRSLKFLFCENAF